MRVPEISTELLEFLKRFHPNTVIGEHETYEHHLRRAGFQDCLDLMQHHHDLQNDNSLTIEEREALEEEDFPEPEGGIVRIGGSLHTRPR